MAGQRRRRVDSICCLLHSLTAGGAAWQWIRLLGRHVEHGGRATIFAPPGVLTPHARKAGIELVPTAWEEREPAVGPALMAAIGGHNIAVVQWERGTVEAFAPALAACGRAALTIHHTPQALARWAPAPAVRRAREALEQALADRFAVVLTRGDAHRRRIAAALDLDTRPLLTLPAAVDVSAVPFLPVPRDHGEVLAMTRLSPEKEPVVRLAAELVAARLAAGRPCRLTVAGEGPWRAGAAALCERLLPPGSWWLEGAPADPMARLAAAPLVVAQGVTTLEAAALGRRTVVARSAGEEGAAGVVLTPGGYAEAAQDPFGEPPLSTDAAKLWADLVAVGESELAELRRLVETENSLEAADAALAAALARTAGPAQRIAALLRR